MQPNVDASVRNHLVRRPLPPVRVKRRRHHDRHGLGRRAEIEEPPGRPALVGVPALPLVFLGREYAGAGACHAVDHFHAEAGDCHLIAIVHVVEDEHHAA